MKTSVVIPATPGNFVFLNSVIQNYAEGTVKPDEIVVSLSNGCYVDGVDALEKRFSSVFEDFKVLIHDKVMVQGPNRDAATMATKNEIIISNDADDVPHPQRVEIIKHFFETQPILHLNHSYQKNERNSEEQSRTYKHNAVPYDKYENTTIKHTLLSHYPTTTASYIFTVS